MFHQSQHEADDRADEADDREQEADRAARDHEGQREDGLDDDAVVGHPTAVDRGCR